MGTISCGNQFNTFSNGSFIGNLGLYRFPLSNTCNYDTNDQPPQPTFEEEDDDSEDTNGWNLKIIMMGYGCGLVIGIPMGYVLLYYDGKLSWLSARIVRKQLYKRVRRPKKNKSNHVGARYNDESI